DALQKKIGDAAAAMGKASKQDAMERAAEKARDLTRGLESLDQRMRDRSQNGRNQNGQQNGQNGQRSNQNGQQGNQSGQQSAQNGQQGGQSGQQGSQDGQNASGANNGGRANDGFTNGSPNRGGAYGGDARNWGGYYGGYWNADDIRQWRREYREWANDADALRRQRQQNRVSPRELQGLLRDLQKFDNDRVYTDPRGLEQLQAAALEKLKKFEFSLRRKSENGNDSLSLSGSDQVPDGFRQAIEEYYRSLSRKAVQPQPR